MALSLISAFLFSALANWMMVRGRAWLPQDEPNARSLHMHAVPRSGGIGIVLGVGAACWILPTWGLPIMLGLAVSISVLSLLDDARGLPVWLRFGSHLAVALAFLWFYAPAEWGAVAWLLALLAMVWMTNLYNFMDGSDGLAGGMALFGFGALGAAAWLAGDMVMAQLGLSVAAAAAGFLLFNFHPAKIFMGDVGAIPLGFMAAAIGLLGYWRGLWPWMFPMLIFSPFIVDASVTLLRRLLRGERVWQAHREHYYQRLIRSGIGHRVTAVGAYGLMLSCAVLALYSWYRQESMLLVVFLLGALYLVLMIWLDRRWRMHEH